MLRTDYHITDGETEMLATNTLDDYVQITFDDVFLASSTKDKTVFDIPAELAQELATALMALTEKK